MEKSQINIVKYSDKMELDLMLNLARTGHSFYRELFKKVNSLINYKTPNEKIEEFIKKEIDDYCKQNLIDNHYVYMLDLYDCYKYKLPFDETLIKPFFNCFKKLDENNKISFVFEIQVGHTENEEPIWETLYTSYKVKEKNAWRDFIKFWWFSDKNKSKRIECYKDIYNAICVLEQHEDELNKLNVQES